MGRPHHSTRALATAAATAIAVSVFFAGNAAIAASRKRTTSTTTTTAGATVASPTVTTIATATATTAPAASTTTTTSATTCTAGQPIAPLAMLDPGPGKAFSPRPAALIYDSANDAGLAGGVLVGARTVTVSPPGNPLALGITVTGAKAAGSIRVYPAGSSRPGAPVLTFGIGETAATYAISAVNNAGQLVIESDGGCPRVQLHTNGAFEPIAADGPGTLVSTSAAPQTLLDTRTATCVTGSKFIGAGALAAAPGKKFSAVLLRLTASAGTMGSGFGVHAGGTNDADLVPLRFSAGTTRTTTVLAEVGGGNRGVWLRNLAGCAHVVVEAIGYVEFDGYRGFPTSTNAASSFHLNWDSGQWSTHGGVTGAAVTLEVTTRPGTPDLNFWSLSATIPDPSRASTDPQPGAHMGLQHQPYYPGYNAVNWGGYDGRGGELSGTTSTLTNPTANPNVLAYGWSTTVRYRYEIVRTSTGWAAYVTNLSTNNRALIRELSTPGAALINPGMWLESFGRCNAASITHRWSNPTVTTPSGTFSVTRASTSYQAVANGGCLNTNTTAETGAFVQRTNVPRTTPAGTMLTL